MKLTNRQAQTLYHIVQDAQFECKENSKAFNEMQKIIAQNPFDNPKFCPVVDSEILGYWLHNEISDFIDFFEQEMQSDSKTRSEATTQEMVSMINLEAKTELYYTGIRKRFKMLALLALNVGVWEDKMQDLGDKLDENHPDAVEALCFYEDKIIEVLEAKEVEA